MSGRVLGTVEGPDFLSFEAREKFEDCTRLAIQDQERLGLDVISDSNQYMESATPFDYELLFETIPNRIEGTVAYGPSVPFPGWEKFHTITVKSELKWVRPIFAPVMEVVRRYTEKPIKLNVFGVTGQSLFLHDEYYKDPEALAFALAAVYNAELKDLVSKGLVDIVQFLDLSPNYMATPYIADTVNAATEGVDADIWVHSCMGNATDRFYVPGSADVMMPDALKINMQVLHLALAHPLRAPDLDMFKKWPLPPHVALGAGVVDVKDPTPDGDDTIVARIERVLEVVDPNQVVLMPDCGWMNKLRHTAWDKNAELVAAANIVRARYQ